VQLTGAFRPLVGWEAFVDDEALARFLLPAAGDPLALVTFGSMASLGRDAIHFPRTLLCSLARALAAARLRGLLLLDGASELGAAWRAAAAPGASQVDAWPHMHALLRPAPLEALLPRCVLALHHGGAGTTQACAAAGVPQLILPFMFDQFDWAERAQHSAVSPPALQLQAVLADPRRGGEAAAAAALAAGLCAARAPALAAAARALAASMALEDGLSDAVHACLREAAAGCAAAVAVAAAELLRTPPPAAAPRSFTAPGGARLDGGGSCQRELLHIWREVFVRDCYLRHGFGGRLPRGATVLDVGAHVGLFALRCAALFARRGDGEARVLALEPVPAAHTALLANTRAAGCVSALRVGLGLGRSAAFAVWPLLLGQSTMRREEKMQLTGHLIDAPLWAGEEEIVCPLLSLSELLAQHLPVGARVSLLKVDVEGAEMEVLQVRANARSSHALTHPPQSGAAADWARIDAAVVEVTTGAPGRLAAVTALLREAGLIVQHVDSGVEAGNPRDTALVFARRPNSNEA